MLYRRHCIAAGLILAAGWPLRPARAQVVERASAFVKQMGDRLTAVVNGPGGLAEKRRALAQILDGAVDVDGVAKFCLGRFWRTASAEQQARYLAAFRDVLTANISSRLGEYKGVRLTVVRGRPQEQDALVTTTVERPNSPPTAVDWLIGQPAANPKIIDVVAEGTSLRLTQRQDYAAFLSRNNNDVGALIAAMQQQAARSG